MINKSLYDYLDFLEDDNYNLDGAFLGISQNEDTIYSYSKIIEILMESGMEFNEAHTYFHLHVMEEVELQGNIIILLED